MANPGGFKKDIGGGLVTGLSFMRISPAVLSRKINSFLDQLHVDEQYVVLYPFEMDVERAITIAKAKGWKQGSKDILHPCFSLSDVVVRRLA